MRATCCSALTTRTRPRRRQCSASSPTSPTPSIVPELLSRLEGKDPIARTHIINILARFNRRDVAVALQRQLKDTNKFVRQAVLNALTGFEGNVDVGLLCDVLRDPDVETQQKAIDASCAPMTRTPCST